LSRSLWMAFERPKNRAVFASGKADYRKQPGTLWVQLCFPAILTPERVHLRPEHITDGVRSAPPATTQRDARGTVCHPCVTRAGQEDPRKTRERLGQDPAKSFGKPLVLGAGHSALRSECQAMRLRLSRLPPSESTRHPHQARSDCLQAGSLSIAGFLLMLYAESRICEDAGMTLRRPAPAQNALSADFLRAAAEAETKAGNRAWFEM